MIFSLDRRSLLKGEVGEIRCPYNQLGTIIKFINSNPDKRYNIILSAANQEELEKAIKQIDIVKDITQNYTISCSNIPQLLHLLSNKYHAYIYFPVADWETFMYLRELEVSDIHIDGPLAFQADKVKSAKGEIKIRVSPTISSNAALAEERKPSSFFIRPEDLDLYAEVIDVIDFNVGSLETEEALYKVYQRKEFLHDIDSLILRLPKGVSNLAFKPAFAEQRLNCGQKCNVPGRSCHFCDNFFTLVSKFNQMITDK